MKIIGIDIGTTSVCGVVVLAEQGMLLRSSTRPNDSAIPAAQPFARCQDPKRILQICTEIYSDFLNEFPDTKAVGFTGQMHGILYLDAEGDPVSPLYTWQDGRGNETFGNSTYAQELSVRTGFSMATGYGITTMYYNKLHAEEPSAAVQACTIHDYVAMQFCRLHRPVMHVSDAASFGLFDLKEQCFCADALEKAGLNGSLLPQTVQNCRFIGETQENIPVSVPIGDNQASVLGSLCENAVLINVGTGSQVSAVCEEYIPKAGIEYRPYIDGKYLMTGCALSGGYSYSLLKKFFEQVFEMFGAKLPENAYEFMNAAAEQAKPLPDHIICEPYFCGTRENPSQKASFAKIDSKNFAPQQLTLSVLNGICEELLQYYRSFCTLLNRRPKKLVGSGNGIRKNVLLAKIFSERFEMPLYIPRYEEEAAFGSAYSAYIALKNISAAEIQKLIQYREVVS